MSKPADLADYRAILEAVLAHHVIEEDAELAKYADTPQGRESRAEEAAFRNAEINGLCIALRLLGGYEGVAFDLEWARAVPATDFDWRGAI